MARVAIASNNGTDVDEHFGRANFFRIYDVTDNGYSFLESRDVVAACQHAVTHNKTDFDRVIDLLADCDALLVQKVGESVASYLISRGMRVFEVNGGIGDVLDKFIKERLL